MNYQWNWQVFGELAPDAQHTYLETLAMGLGFTLSIALFAGIIAFVIGFLIGVLKTLPNKWLNLVVNAYIELFRNIPLLVQMFLWYFVIPELLPPTFSLWVKALPNASVVTAVICLGLFTSARIALQVFAGITSLPKEQKWAALALGLTTAQSYRYVLLPIASRRLIPVFTSEFLNLIKNSAVALTIGVVELTASAYAMQEFTFRTFEALSAVTLIYLFLNLLIVNAMRWLEHRKAIPGYIIFSDKDHV